MSAPTTNKALNPHNYPYKENGSVNVRCRSCGKRGLTSKRFVGRAKAIDQCGECKRRNKGGGETR